MSPFLCLSFLLVLFGTGTCGWHKKHFRKYKGFLPGLGGIHKNVYKHVYKHAYGFKRLKCFECSGEHCRGRSRCKPGMVCMTSSVVESINGTIRKYVRKGCTTPSYCPKRRHRNSLSLSFGTEHIVANVKCCKRNNCNRRDLPYPEMLPEVGLKCSFCNNKGYDCSSTVCLRGQSKCVKLKRKGHIQSGCATSNFCSSSKLFRRRQIAGFAGRIRFPAICSNPETIKEDLPSKCTPKTTTPEPDPTSCEKKKIQRKGTIAIKL